MELSTEREGLPGKCKPQRNAILLRRRKKNLLQATKLEEGKGFCLMRIGSTAGMKKVPSNSETTLL
jgi:hypothetical protein